MQSEGYHFEGVGTISLKPPSEDLKPFMRRKFKTFFRIIIGENEGILTKQDLMKLASHHFVEKRESKEELATKYVVQAIVVGLLFGRDSITEEEFVEEWMSRVYSDPQSRKKFLEKLLYLTKRTYEPIDSDGKGFINMKEFDDCFSGHHLNITPEEKKVLFNTVDANKDGFISVTEFQYGLLNHHLCSGPDSIFSLWYGKVVEEE